VDFGEMKWLKFFELFLVGLEALESAKHRVFELKLKKTSYKFGVLVLNFKESFSMLNLVLGMHLERR
jgi:hypothetical protein